MEKIKLLLLGILFLVCMGTVLRILPYGISFLAVVIVGMIAFRDLFAQVDYFLLGTFAGFFIFVGNVQRIPSVSRWIGSVMEGKEFWLSIGCSQIISNVPATMLLSGFTTEYKAVSYTHLDVYKRQRQRFLRLRFTVCMCIMQKVSAGR